MTVVEAALPPCECGCGNLVTKSGNTYIAGHHRRAKPERMPEEVIERALQEPMAVECGRCTRKWCGVAGDVMAEFRSHRCESRHMDNRAQTAA